MTVSPGSFRMNTAGHRLLGRLLLPLLFIAFPPSVASGKGGTNVHELRDAQTGTQPFRNDVFGGCGRGRYRDPHTGKCRGPADFGK